MPKAQAIFLRRRHQARRPPLAKIRPGSPAPATGPGTGAFASDVRTIEFAGSPNNLLRSCISPGVSNIFVHDSSSSHGLEPTDVSIPVNVSKKLPAAWLDK